MSTHSHHTGPPVVVIGAGGHAAEVCAYFSQLAATPNGPRLLGCVDDHAAVDAGAMFEVLGTVRHLTQLLQANPNLHLLTATGDNLLRRLLVARAEAIGSAPAPWWTLVHPHAS